MSLSLPTENEGPGGSGAVSAGFGESSGAASTASAISSGFSNSSGFPNSSGFSSLSSTPASLPQMAGVSLGANSSLPFNPAGAPCPRQAGAFGPPDLALMSSQDREELRILAQRGRVCAVLASVGLGLLSFRIFKRREARFPVLGSVLVGLTFGPPLGFAGYMTFNYSQVQRVAEKFREAQLKFEAARMAQQMQGPNVGVPFYPGISSPGAGSPSSFPLSPPQNTTLLPPSAVNASSPETESFTPAPGELLRT